jgi:PH (Pleckstrin Homology) domain-containing protein
MEQRNYYKLNEGEEVIGSSDTASIVFDKGGFLLTNHRVVKVDRTPFGGESKVHSIHLENIDSIQTTAIKNNVFILLAVGSLFLFGISDVGPFLGTGGFILFCILFFLTRRKVIQLASGNSTMSLNITALAHERIQEMVFEIEQAKQRRLEGIQGKSSERSVSANEKQSLKKLQGLLDDGLVTEEEYKSKRQQILDRL